MKSMSTKSHKKIKIDFIWKRHKKNLGSIWKRRMMMESVFGDSKKAEVPLSLIESDILPRLSAKSVGRCRCVCKHWKSFLSTPTFARAHLQYHKDNYKLLLLDGQPPATTFRSSSTIPIPIPNPDPSAEFILASLDGLVCLALRENPATHNLAFWNPLTDAHEKSLPRPSYINLAFWNPLTGAYKKLSPRPGFRFSLHDSDVISFYIDSSNNYKLLYMVMGGYLGAYIYSHRWDSWREVEFVPSHEFCRCSHASLCGECLYFTVTNGVGSNSWVVCFDVKTESFRRIPFPPAPAVVTDLVTDLDCCGSLVVLDGCLHLCVYTDYYDRSKWRMNAKQGDLWRMNGDGDGWVKVATFSDKLTTTRKPICTETTASNGLVVLDFESNCLKKMNTEDFTKQYHYFSSPSWEYRSSRMMYVETLVSPNP